MSSKKDAQKTSESWPLPLPKAVVSHHLRALETPMREWASKKRVPPVLLLTGGAGVGKRSLVYYLAQWIGCERVGFAASAEDSGPDLFGGLGGGLGVGLGGASESAPAEPEFRAEPCGECLQCERALHATWVDFTEVTAEGDAESDESANASGKLKVDQFRKIKGQVGFGAHEGGYKIILIPNADRMTPQAANSMLKLLEEPPARWVFFLTASDPTLILPTVLSRCQTLRLRPFTTPELETLLRDGGIPESRIGVCAELAQGSWGRAFSLSSDRIWEKRQELFGFLESPQTAIDALVDWAATDKSNFDLLLDQLEVILGDLVVWSADATAARTHSWKNRDGAQTLAKHSVAFANARGGLAAARNFWIGRSERLAEIRLQSLAPLNKKLLAQDLLSAWLAR